VRMIQPVSALNPQATFRGSDGKHKKTSNGQTTPKIALLNAGALAVAAGGLSTIAARGATRSWTQAGFVGACASTLAMFFMAPQLIQKITRSDVVKKTEREPLLKEETKVVADVLKEQVKNGKKVIHFKQSA